MSRVDRVGADVVMDYLHHRVHEGDLHSAFLQKTLSTSTGSISIKAPSNKRVHVIGRVDSTGAGTLIFRRGDVLQAATGSVLSPVRNDEGGNKTLSCEARDTPTVTTPGTVVRQRSVPANGADELPAEYVIAPGGILHVLFTSSGSATVQFNLLIYEE